ncbi:MAG: hypothetical protein ACO1RX_01170 [Candidatus Sericytochromatia bacterium]
MKALFHCHSSGFKLPAVWSGSPFLLPICNKPLVEYWLDLCIWLGIQEILVVTYDDNEAIAAHCGDGHDWGLKLHYVSGQNDDELPELLSRHAAFFNQDTLILDGPVFPFYDRKQLKPMLPSPSEALVYRLDSRQIRLNDTCLLFPRVALEKLLEAGDERSRFQHWISLPFDQHPQLNFPVVLPNTLADYSQLNLEVLSHASRFNLKGFEVAPGVFEGIHNDIAQRPSLGGPVITGQLCKLGPEVQLERVVLHDQVRLEGQTQLRNCLVWGPLYLAEVSLENRLIRDGQCIDPETGESTPLEQPWRLKSALEDAATRQTLQAADTRQALRLLSWRWPLYQLLRWCTPSELRKYYLNANGETLVLRACPRPENPNALQRLFFGLSLDKVPLLQAVRAHGLLLVGTRLLPKSHEALRYMRQLPIYAPGAFSHSEGLAFDSLPHLMEELDYCSQVSEARNQSIWQNALAQARDGLS